MYESLCYSFLAPVVAPEINFTRSLLTSECKGAADVVFAVDASGSIGRVDFMTMIGFVQHAVDGLDVERGRHGNDEGARVGLVTFGNDVQLQFDLGDHLGKLALLEAFQVRYTAGTTNTAAALR